MRTSSFRHIPNALSIGRMLAVIPIGFWLHDEDYLPATVLFLAAALTDALDGALARAYNWQSRLGGVLDPIADKLLMLVSAVLLCWNGLLPLWLLLLMLVRDVLIVVGALVHHHWFEPFQPQPSVLGKLCTAFQFLLLAALMLQQIAGLGPSLITPLLYATALVLCASGIDYVYRYTCSAFSRRSRSP
jgi:cardiolipin synthase (CMP-forming)